MPVSTEEEKERRRLLHAKHKTLSSGSKAGVQALETLGQYAYRGERLLGLLGGTVVGGAINVFLDPGDRTPVGRWLPDWEQVPEAFGAFEEQRRRGDWDAAIAAYQDALDAGPGFWGTSEGLTSAFVPTGVPAFAGAKLMTAAPRLAETIARIAPRGIRPGVETGIRAGLSGAGQVARVPWEVEEAVGRGAIKGLGFAGRSVLHPRTGPMAQAIRRFRRGQPPIAEDLVLQGQEPGMPARAIESEGIQEPFPGMVEEPPMPTPASPTAARPAAPVAKEPWLTDPIQTEAIANTAGAEITEEGLLLRAVRYQKPEQAGMASIRSAVFYLPEVKSPYQRYYTTGKVGYGGKQRIEKTVLIRNPIILKGASGGKVPERAYDMVMGKGAYQAMRDEVLVATTRRYGRLAENERLNAVADVLAKYGGDEGMTSEIVRFSKEGNQLPYAVQENIVANAVRNAGYDAILGYNKVGGKNRLSEVFSLSETYYPDIDDLVRSVPTTTAPPGAPGVPDVTGGEARLKDIRAAMHEIVSEGQDAAGTGLKGITGNQAIRYQQLAREASSIRFDLGLPLDVNAIKPASERLSILSTDEILVAHNALHSDKNVYMAISEASAGAWTGSPTVLDDIVNGTSQAVSLDQFYGVFAPVRNILRQKHGDTIRLYRATGKQIVKPTTNWTSTREGALQYGTTIIERDVPIDDILAVNVGRGNYEEFIVSSVHPTPTRPTAARAAPTGAPGVTEPDIITKLFRQFAIDEVNARLGREFIDNNLRPAFISKFGVAPEVMDVKNIGGERFIAISTAGWKKRAQELGLEFVREDGFQDLYRMPGQAIEGATPLPGGAVARAAGGVDEGFQMEMGFEGGTGGNTQQMPLNVGSRAEAQASIAKEAYDAVPGSPVDRAAAAYWRTGNFDDFIGNMGPPDDPFPLLPGFEDAPMQDPSKASAYFADPTRMVQGIDEGVFGSWLQRAVLWPTRRTFMASLKFGDTTKTQLQEIFNKHNMAGWRDKKLRESSGDVLEHISREDLGVPVEVLLTRPAIRTLLQGVNRADHARVVGLAQDTRRFFDDVLDKQNSARTARGQDLIPYLQNYRPWVRETNIWARLGFADQPVKDVAAGIELPDYIKPNAPFNPRAVAREGGLEGYAKVRDLQKLGMDYVDTASKDIFYTNIVQNAKVHIKQMRTRGGLANAAGGVEDWIMEAYAGQLPAISKFGRKLPSPVTTGLFAMRRNLTRAVFPLNWIWNLFVQPSSVSLTIHRYGITDTLKGLGYLVSPTLRKEIRDNAYSSIIKARRSGQVAYQDIGAGIEKTAAIQRSPIERAEDFGNILTTLIEDNLTGVSVRAAYHSGKRQGLSGRALWEFASEGGSKTQSMYNLQDLPGMLRAREVGTIAPFQTFAFEIMNTVRELGFLPMGARTGMYRTTQNRLWSLARWLAAIVVFSAISDKAVNRQPWQLSSFVPFWGVLTGGVNAGNAWNLALPLKYTHDLYGGIQGFMKYGNWKKLRTWAIRYHMYGGTQVNLTLRGIEAVADGDVRDAAGSKLFDTEPPEGWESRPGRSQAWLAITQGPYAVTEGREYVENLKKDPLSEFIGFDVDFRQSEEEKQRRAVNALTLNIGGVESNYSDLYKHPEVIRYVKHQLPPDLHDLAEEYIEADYKRRDEMETGERGFDIRNKVQKAVANASSVDGALWRLRGEFLRAAPNEWKAIMALLGKSFPGSDDIREWLLRQQEAGSRMPDIDYSQWNRQADAIGTR